MTTGLSATTADAFLASLTNFYNGLHTADPGAAGTTSPCTGSVGASRQSSTMGAAGAGSGTRQRAQSNTPSWTPWDGGSVTISHISNWSASTSGTFQFSGALTSSKAITNGDTFNLTSLVLSLTPIAA